MQYFVGYPVICGKDKLQTESLFETNAMVNPLPVNMYPIIPVSLRYHPSPAQTNKYLALEKKSNIVPVKKMSPKREPKSSESESEGGERR